MNNEKFVYVIYIAAPVDKVWQSLFDHEMTRQYWGHDTVSDWKPGSAWQLRRSDGSNTLNVVGEVVECVAPKRLVLSWGDPANEADKTKRSRVTLELEPVADMVRLTVNHEDFVPGSETRRRIGNGWPRVLSSLKSFLETGKPLDVFAA